MSAASMAESFGELVDEHVRLGRVGAAEDGLRLVVDVADVVGVLAAAEIGPIAVVDQGEDRPADRHTRPALMAGLHPDLPEEPDLLGL